MAKSQMKYFIPMDSITANTYRQAKIACNRNWARLRNIWDDTFTIDALRTHFGVDDSTIKAMYSIDPGTGDIESGLVVCESKLPTSRDIMVSYVKSWLRSI